MVYLEPGPWNVVAELRDFYRDTVGLEIESEIREESVWFCRPAGSRCLGFHVGDGLSDPGTVNLCFRVADVDLEAVRISELGVPLIDLPTDMPWGDRIVTFADPAGHTVWLLGSPVG